MKLSEKYNKTMRVIKIANIFLYLIAGLMAVYVFLVEMNIVSFYLLTPVGLFVVAYFLWLAKRCVLVDYVDYYNELINIYYKQKKE